MIKHDGVDIPRIEYIDPVDGKVSILRVMQDGVQIWPADAEPLQIPTGITLREVFVTKPNIPTGIQLGEYDIEYDIEWDFSRLYAGQGQIIDLVTMYFSFSDADITSVPDATDFTFVDGNTVTNVSLFADRIELTVTPDFYFEQVIYISYTAGANPIKGTNGVPILNLSNQRLDNLLEQEPLQIPTGIILTEV